MINNIEVIKQVIGYIEENLDKEKLDLDSISKAVNYSKYHLHRIFSFLSGLTVHEYIIRRRLTKAAALLVNTDRPIIEIALNAGYETQRSFSKAFKNLYGQTPKVYRNNKEHFPIQLKYDIDNDDKIPVDIILKIERKYIDNVNLIGYEENTKKGFKIIGKCWRRLHQNKGQIENRIDFDYLIGINDYTNFEKTENMTDFKYFAGAEVKDINKIPKGMTVKNIKKSKYIEFTLRGKNEDSMEPVFDYIYKKWLPKSTCILNEENLYDIIKYNEHQDEKGENHIEVLIPIL
ncbi:helix-turn-helix domain-containing protein [uncultured Anaerofustis sp.]|uniref:AraC family transcriptional regulator n=1 Tax=uncultured Anaerofustis sp. TaxID=904996 RepID=UPI0025E7F4B3|nr:helix-turn-helix domain-containing protein [uncultured Anaerofustis sp.]